MKEEEKKEVEQAKINSPKRKILKIILFILFLIILAASVSSGVYFYLKQNNERDSISQMTYIGILEDGTYYIPKARKDIRFEIDSLDVNSYNLVDKNNNKVETTIIERNEKKLIQANQPYNEGETYTLELTGTTFSEEQLKDAKKLKFKIEEPEKAEYQFEENVRIIENESEVQVQENESGKTIKIPNGQVNEDEIILVKDNEEENSLEAAYKIEKVENGVATVTTPQIAEIYKELDLYQEHKVNFDELKIDEDFKDKIELAVKKTDLYKFLENESYAADNIETKPKVIQNGNQLKIEIDILVKANGQEFLGIKALTNHDLTLKFIIDLEADFIEDAQKENNIGIDMAIKQGYEFTIDLQSSQTILEGVDELSDEEYCKTIQDIIAKLEGATEDKTKGKMPMGGVSIPTGIPFVNAYFDIYFQTELGLQISLTYNQRVELVQHMGISIDSQGATPYANTTTSESTAELTVLGKAEMRLGIGFDIGISFGSKDLAHVGIGNEAGLYGELFATMNTTYSSRNQHINENFVGKVEAGVYFKTKFVAGIDVFFIEMDYQKDLAEVKIPFIKLGTDEITTAIKATPNTVTISNNSIPVPNITRVIRNLSEGEEREEACQNVTFKDKDGNTLSRTGNVLSLGKNEDTTIKAVYEESSRIYQVEIKVQKQETQTSNNQTTEVFSNIQNQDIVSVYQEYLKNKKYEKYSSKWEANAGSYCICDINQDGIEELLIMSENQIGWRNTLVCTYNKSNKQVIEVQDIYSYGELRYSVENKEIVYAPLKPYKDVGVHEFYQLKNNKLVISRAAGWEAEGKYFISIEGVGKKTVTADECNAEFKKLAYFKFTQL